MLIIIILIIIIIIIRLLFSPVLKVLQQQVYRPFRYSTVLFRSRSATTTVLATPKCWCVGLLVEDGGKPPTRAPQQVGRRAALQAAAALNVVHRVRVQHRGEVMRHHL
jgi:hypothetical protein